MSDREWTIYACDCSYDLTDYGVCGDECKQPTRKVEVVPKAEAARLKFQLGATRRSLRAERDNLRDTAEARGEDAERWKEDALRLRAERDEWNERADLNAAELARLRAALREIAEGGEWPTFPEFAVKTARAALDPEGEAS